MLFRSINTAAIPTELLESELFGHEKGSFTGAHARHTGRFEEAAGGTLFLDEIGDMPLPLQTRLLRVLAEGDYYRVGGRDLLRADVRLLTATHQDLEKKIADGSFREDLYHRLNVITIEIPPLRERTQDIALLARHFLRTAAKEMDLEEKQLLPETVEALQQKSWPGNVRQLRNIVERLLILATDDAAEAISADLLPSDVNGATGGNGGRTDLVITLPLREAREIFEREYLLAQINRFGGNISRTASFVGMERSALHRKLKALGVSSTRSEANYNA